MIYHKAHNLSDYFFCYTWRGDGNNCNTTVLTNVIDGNKHIIIDPGHITNEAGLACFASLEQAMLTDKIKIENIGLIINTHSHADHCMANEIIIQRSGASVTLSKEEDNFRLTAGKSMYSRFGHKPPDFTPSFHLKEGILDTCKDKLNIQVLLTPGHSPGSICLYIEDIKALITGDVIFFVSVGRTDFPGGNVMQLKNSIDKLALLDVEYMIPGHNTESNGVICGKDLIQRNFIAVQGFF
jgi:hydroxyacylglutathione hydrolase